MWSCSTNHNYLNWLLECIELIYYWNDIIAAWKYDSNNYYLPRFPVFLWQTCYVFNHSINFHCLTWDWRVFMLSPSLVLFISQLLQSISYLCFDLLADWSWAKSIHLAACYNSALQTRIQIAKNIFCTFLYLLVNFSVESKIEIPGWSFVEKMIYTYFLNSWITV